MKIEQIYTGCLAQGAYYIESNGEAAIIDPLRETKVYIDKATANGVKIKYVFETHFHADFVSGHLDLAKKTASHPLAKSRGLTLTLEDTLDFPWIAPPKETPAGQFLFEKLRIQDRPETPVRVVSSSLAVLRGVLAQGNYVSIVSRHQVHVDAQLGSIIPLNIRLSGHKRNIGLTFRRNWTPTKTQQQFIDFLRQQAKLNETPC